MRTENTQRGGSGLEASALPLLLFSIALAATVFSVWSVGGPETAMPMATEVEQAATDGAQIPAEDEAPDPVGVRIGSLDIDVETIPLGLQDDGSLEVPEDPHLAGWWTGGANPGERGPSVIVGHVDSRDGPGAFYGLGDLQEGERVSVDRGDGTGVHFLVDRVETHPKDDFPTAAVYGDTEAPTLRLVTCAGEFDPRARSYEDNVVVFLTLEGWSGY
jgi:hypothetical protein